MNKLYEGNQVAFLTQHGKEALIAPILEPFLGCHIVRIEGYDTDQLGTFSGEIRRFSDQIETAREKANIGMSLSDLPIAIASEGAFVPDPFSGLMPWNIEVILWRDVHRHIEVVGVAQGPARSVNRAIRTIADLENFAQEAGFPQHRLVLRPQSEIDHRIYKGIADWGQLRQAFLDCHELASNGLVYAENDHRAFCNPTRQAMIQQATHDLVKKFQSTCPACTTPGFAISGHTSGLICRACGNKTRRPLSYTLTCNVCHHTVENQSSEKWADPSECDVCNP